MNDIGPTQVKAIVVNHNTSKYTELMLRSLACAHRRSPAVTILDNKSTDDTVALDAYARENGIELMQSGFDTTQLHSHGELLTKFILDNPEAPFLLFIDSDACFVEENTIDEMLAKLAGTPSLFAVQVQPSLVYFIEEEVLETLTRYLWEGT